MTYFEIRRVKYALFIGLTLFLLAFGRAAHSQDTVTVDAYCMAPKYIQEVVFYFSLGRPDLALQIARKQLSEGVCVEPPKGIQFSPGLIVQKLPNGAIVEGKIEAVDEPVYSVLTKAEMRRLDLVSWKI